jgi:nitrogen fixation protein NifU and related proteins
MDPAGLYREVVIAHNRAPRRFVSLVQPTHAGRGANPACGDDLAVQLRVRDGRIDELGFGGEGCAVAIATASMLGDSLAGAEISRIAALRAAFARLLAGEAAVAGLGELQALSGLREHPARHRCAWLAFEAVEDALAAGSR